MVILIYILFLFFNFFIEVVIIWLGLLEILERKVKVFVRLILVLNGKICEELGWDFRNGGLFISREYEGGFRMERSDIFLV